MSVRLGVELSPVSCRFVELDSSPASSRSASHTRIRSFARMPREGADTRNALSRFRSQSAIAVVWGLQADHRYAVVPHGSFRRMRRDAVAGMQGAGVETRGRVADIFAARRAEGAPTRSVVVALASTPGLASAARWLGAQGVRVHAIVTPALALMSLARLRRELTSPDRVEAYVALEETTTAVALVRNGLLLAASELSWGYQDNRGVTLTREEIAGRLADEIERFLAARAARPDVLVQVCICGGLPELRSMAMMLMERLDVEVETLDSLLGIDTVHLPEPSQEFREHAADLRLAWAAATDWPAPVNLLRERTRRVTKTMLSRAAVAAGVATGIGVAWQVQQSEWWRSAPAPRSAPTRTVSRSLAEPHGAAAAVRPPPAAVAVRPAPAPAPQSSPAAPVSPSPALEVRPLQSLVARAVGPPARLPEPPPAARSTAVPPTSARSQVVAPVARSPVAQPIASPVARLPVAPPRVAQSPVVSPVVPERPAQRAVRPPAVQSRETDVPRQAERQPSSERLRVPSDFEVALPFDAVLGTILYAPERKLAIVDGRIVQTGDEINGAQVVEITQTTVLLRDARGRLRRLALGGPAR
jgi:hypothetical protein